MPYMCTGLCNIKIKGSVSSTIVLSKHDEYECDEYNADIEKCIEDGMRPKGKVMIHINIHIQMSSNSSRNIVIYLYS